MQALDTAACSLARFSSGFAGSGRRPVVGQPLAVLQHQPYGLVLHVRRVLVPAQREAHKVAQPRVNTLALLPIYRGTAAQLLRQLLCNRLEHQIAEFAKRALVVGKRVVKGQFGQVEAQLIAPLGRQAATGPGLAGVAGPPELSRPCLIKANRTSSVHGKCRWGMHLDPHMHGAQARQSQASRPSARPDPSSAHHPDRTPGSRGSMK